MLPFVNLHGHTTFSINDGFGYPEDFMRTAHKSGMDAIAITDHGNMNALSYQVEAYKKLLDEGINVKPIFGVEAYLIPSISKWELDYQAASERSKKLSKEKTSGTVIEDEEAIKKEIKTKINRRCHILLLAANKVGLYNIFEMVSKSYSDPNFYRFPRIDMKMLQEFNEGVIASSACLGGFYGSILWANINKGPDAVADEMRKATDQMLQIFGTDRWFGELQWNKMKEQHMLNSYVIQMATEFGFNLLSTADAHFPKLSNWKDREVYKGLGWLGKKKRKKLPESADEMDYLLYPKNGDEMWQSYKDYSKTTEFEYDDDIIRESIIRTHDVAHNQIESFLPDTEVILPDFVVPENKTASRALTEMSIAGLKNLGLSMKEKYVERLKEELHVIQDRGFSKYFLTMKKISDKASSMQLVGPGRGSAAGSLVAYVLGITQVDPIRWGLLFSRFLRKDATDYPDIDYDVSDPMILKEALIEEWGKDSVVPISNWNKLQLRSLIKDVSKLYEIPWSEVNLVTSCMINEAMPAAKAAHNIKVGVYIPTFDEVVKYSTTLQEYFKKYPHVATHINALRGQLRSCSRHAGGVVISTNLNRRMPLINSGGVTQTPWTEGQQTVIHLEPMGFIKFDVLGLASLRMIEGAIKLILKRHFSNHEPSFADIQDFYNKYLHPDTADFKDKKVWENVFHKVSSQPGIFQMTQRGAQDFCERAKPDSLEELSNLTSIYRPGPMEANVPDLYVQAKSDPESMTYDHPTIKKILHGSLGFIIYQEDLALLASTLGKDISLDEGNVLRKLFIKTGLKKEKLKNKLHDKFLAGCKRKNIPVYNANALWKKMEAFSKYGFCKAHAVSYSIISYQCAWLANYYPVEWAAAFLDKEPESRKERAINLVKSAGFNIKLPDINTSGMVWEVDEDDSNTLIQPLTSIKGLGEKAIEQIILNRPFTSIENLLFNENVIYRKLNKKSLDCLVRSQTLNDLMDDRFDNLYHFWISVVLQKPLNAKKLLANIKEYKGIEDFSEEEKIAQLTELMGMFPLHLVMPVEMMKSLEAKKVPPISEFDPDLGLAWCVPREITLKKTKFKKDFYIINVVDSNFVETKIKCWGVRPNKDKIHVNRPYMVRPDFDSKWGYSTRGIISRSWHLLG